MRFETAFSQFCVVTNLEPPLSARVAIGISHPLHVGLQGVR